MTFLEPYWRDRGAARTDPFRTVTAAAVHLACMSSPHTSLSGLDPLLSIDELAEYLGVPIRTIYDWRQRGHGPRGIRIGRHLKYAVSDVTGWIDFQREASPRHDSVKR